MSTLNLKFNLAFKDLANPNGLQELDKAFLNHLRHHAPVSHTFLTDFRSGTKQIAATEQSEQLILCAEQLDHFIAELFDIEKEAQLATRQTLAHNPVGLFKNKFILHKVKRRLHQPETLPDFEELHKALLTKLGTHDDLELAIAQYGLTLLDDDDEQSLEQLTQWCIQAIVTTKGREETQGWDMLRLPEKLDYANLIPTQTVIRDNTSALTLADEALRHRDGFKLTDERMSARQVQNEIHYCVFCHDHAGDLCSKGFPKKKKQPELGFKENPLDITLTGCPLEEKISEMHTLKRDGFTIGALAMVMVDNPMCPATGHRICNDCMKACIYQKQTPVNIPEVETRVLTDTLALPWGVEIYDLLTRWNPLRADQHITKAYNGKKIMIAGMGPAGFTLAHHLLQEGFAVVGFDGLKIEPLPESYINQPIKHYDDITESLDERLMAGFGGVAEYGITVRWDKNFLKLIYISLMRRTHFQVFGGVRFGGTIRVEDAWKMGFDHMVIAVGAGLPRALPIPGSLSTGMRQANDFLMALQLTGAAKKNNLANLQVRLPAIVIGGGLTGVDSATEVQAYYINQVEKISARYTELLQHYPEQTILEKLDIASKEILHEYLDHAQAIIAERKRAITNNEAPNFTSLLRQWGGITIVYRKRMQDSPAYKNNHEELHKAFEEGIYYLECMQPEAVHTDSQQHVCAMSFTKTELGNDGDWATLNEHATVPAKTILVATGASLNVAYSFEHEGTIERSKMQYLRYENNNGELYAAHAAQHTKQDQFGPFTSYQKDDYRVTFIGDTHPVFHGNVVKAIASAKRTYPEIVSLLADKTPKSNTPYSEFATTNTQSFSATVKDIKRLSADAIEVTIHAPLACQNYKPGQFYRLQSFETHTKVIANTLLQAESLAVFASHADKANDTLTFIVFEKNTSAKLVATLKANDPITLMGPTGVRSKVTEHHETLLIMGDERSIPQLLSYGQALKDNQNHVCYLLYLSKPEQLFYQGKIEAIADQIIWVTTDGLINTNRPQDNSFTGNPLDALIAYAQGEFNCAYPFIDIDRIQVIADATLLKAIQKARHHELAKHLPKNPKITGSVHSTMQCMLKGVCAQCLQWQVDPETGKRTKAVYACSWQDQPLELIDFDNIDERLRQNALQDTLSELWVDHLRKTGQLTSA